MQTFGANIGFYPSISKLSPSYLSNFSNVINALSCIKYVLFFFFSSLFQQKALSLQPNKD